MSTEDRLSIPGIVQDGVIIPASDSALPDGAHVEIVLQRSGISAELSAELRAWDSASDEAWNMIEAWESEES